MKGHQNAGTAPTIELGEDSSFRCKVVGMDEQIERHIEHKLTCSANHIGICTPATLDNIIELESEVRVADNRGRER